MTWLNTFLRKLFSVRDQQQDTDVVKPFLDHLEDLRITLFKMAFALAIGMGISFFFHKELMHLVLKPLEPTGLKLTSFVFTEGFMISLKLAFYAGIVLSFPALLYFIAEFILPALTRREKRLLYPGVLFGFGLFALGVIASYNYILPRTIRWFMSYTNDQGIAIMPQAGPYFSFVTHLSIACGLLCELPIVVIALSFLGIVNYQLLSRTRAYAWCSSASSWPSFRPRPTRSPLSPSRCRSWACTSFASGSSG